MNENINLVEILKDCPSGITLYTPLAGEVALCKVDEDEYYPIRVRYKYDGYTHDILFTGDGRYCHSPNSECVLFPSKEQRDWSKFKTPWLKKPKFDPKTLQPFDKVLVRDYSTIYWNCDFVSRIDDSTSNHKFITISSAYRFCIPYNEETKHLVGTTEEAPEYYRYWED